VTQVEDVADAIDAYEQFDRRRPGWLKVVLSPAPARR
jgi:threonine dehydrogenase-like Zn-dependent dehydrogenase